MFITTIACLFTQLVMYKYGDSPCPHHQDDNCQAVCPASELSASIIRIIIHHPSSIIHHPSPMIRIIFARLFVQSDRDCRQFCEDTADCRFYYWWPFSTLFKFSPFLAKCENTFPWGLNSAAAGRIVPWYLLQMVYAKGLKDWDIKYKPTFPLTPKLKFGTLETSVQLYIFKSYFQQKV